MSNSWWQQQARAIDTNAQQHATERQQVLTKPPGSLGRLEQLAIQLASMQSQVKPTLDKVRIVVFAGDHGIAEENVSAFPQVVTREMVKNFARGGAAISVLAKQLNAQLEVVDVGTAHDPGELEGVISQRIAAGTANFAKQAAMTEEQLNAALDCGRQAVKRATDTNTQLLVCGEMGIANTTSATAVAAAILQKSAVEIAGPGTGLDADGVAHKAEVINNAIEHHKADMSDAYNVLRYVGGFEIAALTGSYIAAAQAGITVMVDGFIASIAALAAIKMNPSIEPWLIFSHQSAEPGYQAIMDALSAKPLLDMGMRLGEGSGAALAVCLLRQACALHNDMATFEEAGVSTGD